MRPLKLYKRLNFTMKRNTNVNPKTSLETFGTQAELLAQNGWCPIPLNGKIPVVKEWPRLDDAGRQALLESNHYSGCNAGGQHTNYIGVDVDCGDKQASKLLHSVLKKLYSETGAPITRIGEYPKFMFMLRPVDRVAVKDILFEKTVDNVLSSFTIEMRYGAKKQSVLVGTHPNTAKMYKYTCKDGDVRTPADTHVDELPPLDQAGYDQLVGAFVEAMDPIGYKINTSNTNEIDSDTDAAGFDENNPRLSPAGPDLTDTQVWDRLEYLFADKEDGGMGERGQVGDNEKVRNIIFAVTHRFKSDTDRERLMKLAHRRDSEWAEKDKLFISDCWNNGVSKEYAKREKAICFGSVRKQFDANPAARDKFVENLVRRRSAKLSKQYESKLRKLIDPLSALIREEAKDEKIDADGTASALRTTDLEAARDKASAKLTDIRFAIQDETDINAADRKALAWPYRSALWVTESDTSIKIQRARDELTLSVDTAIAGSDSELDPRMAMADIAHVLAKRYMTGGTMFTERLRGASADDVGLTRLRRPFIQKLNASGTMATELLNPDVIITYIRTEASTLGKLMPASVCKDAAALVADQARRSGITYPVSARYNSDFGTGTVYVALHDTDATVLSVSADGVQVIPDPMELDVRFARSPTALAMNPHESIARDEFASKAAELLVPLNIPRGSWVQVLAWLMASIHHGSKYPVLFLYGESGSGKTEAALILEQAIDPNEAVLMRASKDEAEMRTRLLVNHITTEHNGSDPYRSGVQDMISNGAVDDGNESIRDLFTTATQALIPVGGPVLITAIKNSVFTLDDLRNRTTFVHMTPLPDDKRAPEKELRNFFRETLVPMAQSLVREMLAEYLRMVRDGEVSIAPKQHLMEYGRIGNAVASMLDERHGFDAITAIARGDELAAKVERLGFISDVVAYMVMRLAVSEWVSTARDIQEAVSGALPNSKVHLRKQWDRRDPDPFDAYADGRACRRLLDSDPKVVAQLGLVVTPTGRKKRGIRTLRLTLNEHAPQASEILSNYFGYGFNDETSDPDKDPVGDGPMADDPEPRVWTDAEANAEYDRLCQIHGADVEKHLPDDLVDIVIF